ncbi:MAG: hypothetical protein PVSMB8_00110 [Vulcanimicrobiaceae bacterium]
MNLVPVRAVVGMRGLDTSGKVTRAQAEEAYTRGYRFMGRILGLPPRSAASNLDRAELEMLCDVGFMVFVYQFFPTLELDGPITPELGSKKGVELALAREALEVYPDACTGYGDLETNNPPTKAIAIQYAQNHVRGQRGGGRGGKRAGLYDDVSWPLNGLELSHAGADDYWQAGDHPESPAGIGYSMVQSPKQITIGGLPFDEDVMQLDLHGELPIGCVAEGWVPPAPPSPLPPVIIPPPPPRTYNLRRVIVGETPLKRFLRILYEIAIAGMPFSRQDLEPGARAVPWTCLVTRHSLGWHSRLKPEDGDKTFDFKGEHFGDYGRYIGSGFEQRVAWEGPQSGGAGVVTKEPWPVEPGMCLWTAGHIVTIAFVEDLGGGMYRVHTIEGGQADGAVPRGTQSWIWGEDDKPIDVEINDLRVDDHCQCFIRVLRRTSTGAIAGFLGARQFEPSGVLVELGLGRLSDPGEPA